MIEHTSNRTYDVVSTKVETLLWKFDHCIKDD